MGGRFQLIFVLANENKIDLCRLKGSLSKDETRRDGSNPFIILLSLNHYSFCEKCPKCSCPEPPYLNLIYAHQVSGLSTLGLGIS